MKVEVLNDNLKCLLSSETAFKKDAAVLFLPWSLNNVSICASMCSFNNSSAFALLLPVSRLSVYHLQFFMLGCNWHKTGRAD
jgi:hypothetical protein